MGVEGVGGAGWPLAAGTVLGKYQIVRLLGEGGMGAVYEGLHREMGKRVAIKAMSPPLAAIPEARARFVLEAQVAARVRHPNVIDVTDIGRDGGHPFMVMEYLEGQDLAKHIWRRGPLPIEEVADIALPLLAAVAAAHDEGIVHRDLKPQNVFLAELRDGTIRPTVLDFGISKAPPELAADPIRTTGGGLMGSPSYFAPEQVDDPKAASAASDQFALGVILYECVTGRLPYEGSSLPSIFRAIVRGHYFPARTHRPGLPDGFGAVIARAMALDPGARYPGLRQMGRDLVPFASEATRHVWARHFAETGPAPREATAARPRAGVPVTDQMPASVNLPHATTVSLANGDGALPGDPEISVEPLAIPRSGRAGWMLGGVALTAVGVLALAGFLGRAQAPRPENRSAPAPAVDGPQAAQGGVAAAAPGAGPAARREVRAVDEDEGKTAATATPRHGRPARLRFGPNRAPLIE